MEVLEGFDESFDELFEKIASRVPCVPEKDSAFLRWRYGPSSPQTPVTILGVRDGGELVGYAVLGVTVKSPAGFRDAYILDLVALPGRHDVTQALLGEAVRFFRKAVVPLVRYRTRAPPRPFERRYASASSRKGRNNRLLVKFKDPRLHRSPATSPLVVQHRRWGGDFWVKLS